MTYNGNTSLGYDIGFNIYEIITFKNFKFYEISGQGDPILQGRLISYNDLNPVKLVDFENGTFSETHKPFDFPLYKGKKWEFIDDDNRVFNYHIESKEDVTTPAGTFNSYKIIETEGNSTKSITYYSPDAENVVKKTHYYDTRGNFRLYQLKNHSNEPFERLINTKQLNNRYNTTLEVWEVRYSPEGEWKKDYRVFYQKDGQELTGSFQESNKYYLDWIINNTHEDEKILCWWDYGLIIQGYTGRDSIIDGPSYQLWDTLASPWEINNWNKESEILNVSRALVGSPEETIEVMEQYNASLLFINYRELVLSESETGIFYAPVKGAQRDINDYYEVFIVTESGEKIYLKDFQYDPSITIIDYKIEFKKAYYDSMIYKARFGYNGSDISPEGDLEGLPSISQSLYRYPIMPCRNLTTFKVIYRMAKWNPYPEDEYMYHPDAWETMEYLDAKEKQISQGGVSDLSGRTNLKSGSVILRYFEGAILQGKILYENGTPAIGINITVTDEYNVSHQINTTDSVGNYTLIVPFGNLTITVTQGEVDKIAMIGDVLIETTITVELYQALREEIDKDNDDVFDYYIYKDFEIS